MNAIVKNTAENRMPVANTNRGAMSVPSGGGSHWTLSLKGGRIRLRKGEDEIMHGADSINVVIVDMSPHIQRTFYAGEYNPAAKATAPTCSSIDGIRPDEDAEDKQHPTCRGCPQNVRGSKVFAGRKGFACGFSRLMAVLPLPPQGDELNPAYNHIYLFRASSGALFGKDSAKAGLTLTNYVKAIAEKSADIRSYQLITAMTLDPDSSTPRPLFKPAGWVQSGTALESRVLAALESPLVDDIVNGKPPSIDTDAEGESGEADPLA